MLHRIAGVVLGLILLIAFTGTALAHRPVIEDRPRSADTSSVGSFYGSAVPIEDPTSASLAVYAAISTPGEVDLYTFIAENDSTIPMEVLVPVRPSNLNLAPTLVLLGPDVPGSAAGGLPFPLQPGQEAFVIPSSAVGREAFFEPFSQERLYHGNEQVVSLKAGNTYYVAVFDPGYHTGDYTLGLGTVEDFSGLSPVEVVQDVLAIKFGLIGRSSIPWFDIIGLFVFMAGLVIGLGAVTVIDFHGFLVRRSPYWTEATIRTHKVTKPLIWSGIALVIAGAAILYRMSWVTGVATFQALLVLVLVLNGLFLTFWVSPRLVRREKEGRSQELLPASWQRAIAASFVVSFLGWWSLVFLLAWQLLITS